MKLLKAIVQLISSLLDILSWSNLKKVLTPLWQARVSVLSLLVLTVALIVSDQGQDLILALNEGYAVDLKVLLFYVFLTVLAWYHWYIPVFYMPSNYKHLKNPFTAWRKNDKLEVLAESRLSAGIRYWLGIITIFMGSAAIFKSLAATQALGQKGIFASIVETIGTGGYVSLSLLIFGLLLLRPSVTFFKNLLTQKWFLILLACIFVLVLIVPAFLNDQSPRFLLFVMVGIWYWAFLFYLFLIIREVFILTDPEAQDRLSKLDDYYISMDPVTRSMGKSSGTAATRGMAAPEEIANPDEEISFQEVQESRYRMEDTDMDRMLKDSFSKMVPIRQARPKSRSLGEGSRGLVEQESLTEADEDRGPWYSLFMRFDFVLAILGFIFLLLFVILNFAPIGITQTPITPWTIVTFVSALVSIMILITYLFYMDKRVKKVDIFLLLIIGWIIFYVVLDTNFYHFRTLPVAEDARNFSEREDLFSYSKHWLKDRKDSILAYSKNKPYPIYVVATAGGGIRAAYFTSLLNAHLSDTTEGKYHDHLFALSGASGGTVGSMFYAGLVFNRNVQNIPPGQMKTYTKKTIFGQEKSPHDFLAPTVTTMFGRDNIGAVVDRIPFVGIYNNRGTVLEQAMETGFAWAFQDIGDPFGLDKGFYSMWNPSDSQKLYQTPLVFSNSTEVSRGNRVVVSAIEIDTTYFPSAVDLMKDIQVRSNNKGLDIPMSTAAVMSARFPFVSPGGRNPSNKSTERFVDGGFFDNAGATTAMNVLEGFQILMDSLSPAEVFADTNQSREKDWSKLIQLHVVKIDNDTASTDTIKPFPDILSPLKTILSTRPGHTREAVTALEDKIAEMGGNYYPFNLYRVEIDDPTKIRPIYPLGWELSALAVAGIHENLYQADNQKLVDAIRNALVSNKEAPVVPN